jgi:hypothetical protein
MFNACGDQIGSRAHLHNDYSLDGIGSATTGAFAGIVAWYFLSGLMMHNFGDSGWRKMVSMVAPLIIALPLGIAANHATSDIADGKGFNLGSILMETAGTISHTTGFGQPTFVRAPVSNPDTAVQPRILPMQP